MSDEKPPVEFRPARGHMYVREAKHALDEVVVRDAVSVHAELMGDDSVWIGVYRADGSRVSIHLNIVTRKVLRTERSMGYTAGKRKRMIEMRAEHDEPATNGEANG